MEEELESDLEFTPEEEAELEIFDYAHSEDGVGLIDGDKPILMVVHEDDGEAICMTVEDAKGLVASLQEAIAAEE